MTAKEFIQKRQIIENYAEKDEFINDKARILKGGYLYGDDIGFFWEGNGIIQISIKSKISHFYSRIDL